MNWVISFPGWNSSHCAYNEWQAPSLGLQALQSPDPFPTSFGATPTFSVLLPYWCHPLGSSNVRRPFQVHDCHPLPGMLSLASSFFSSPSMSPLQRGFLWPWPFSFFSVLTECPCSSSLCSPTRICSYFLISLFSVFTTLSSTLWNTRDYNIHLFTTGNPVSGTQ